MSVIDDKRNVLNQVGALTSVKDNFNLPDPTSSLSSINNTNEIVPFLLDLLTVLIGSEALERTVGELMTSFLDNVQPTLKSSLNTQFVDFNFSDNLPASFIAGYTIPAKDIDLFEKLKTDPLSNTGSLLYNNDANDFDRKAYEAINNAGTDITFNNLVIKYEELTDSFTFRPANNTQTIGDFVGDYIDELTIINKNEFTSSIINKIFGTITNNQNKTEKQVIFEEKINKSIDKLIDEEEEIRISDSELREIENESKNKVAGVNSVDVGCGILENSVSLNDLNNLVTGTTNNNDPLSVGRTYTNTLVGSFNEDQSDQAREDFETIKDGFFKRLINAIVNTLVSAIVAPPQIRALLGILSGFKNNGTPTLGDPIDDFIANRQLFDCLVKAAKAAINEFLFNLVKRELLKLIIPVSKIILKEKINQYLAILRSLIGFI